MRQYIYHKVFDVLRKKPMRLWGLSLLSALLTTLAWSFGYLPIIAMPIVWALTVGMESIFLNGYRGNNVECEDLFVGFDKKTFFRNICAMGWKALWLLIWSLIPIAGFVFYIIKGYAYRFVPFILKDDENIKPMDVLKKSEAMAEGYKGQMFCAELILAAIVFAAYIVLGILSAIPYLGLIFSLVLFLFSIAVTVLAPLALGLMRAAFYDEIVNGVDPQKYAAYNAQREAERQMKEQMKAQMEAYRQQQLQAQMAAQQAAAQQAAAEAAAAQQAAAQAAAAQQAQAAAQMAAQQAAAEAAAQAAALAAQQANPEN